MLYPSVSSRSKPFPLGEAHNYVCLSISSRSKPFPPGKARVHVHTHPFPRSESFSPRRGHNYVCPFHFYPLYVIFPSESHVVSLAYTTHPLHPTSYVYFDSYIASLVYSNSIIERYIAG